MLNKKQFSIDVAGKTLTIEVSSLAEQANAAVIAKYGETVVLATAVMARKEAATDYLPLKVDYEEKFYAAGKIIGSRYVRREGRSSEEAILAGRLVDRTIRPLFDDRIRHEIQVVVTVLQIDDENDPEFVGLLGASTALLISDIPWNGPIGGVRVAQDGKRSSGSIRTIHISWRIRPHSTRSFPVQRTGSTCWSSAAWMRRKRISRRGSRWRKKRSTGSWSSRKRSGRRSARKKRK